MKKLILATLMILFSSSVYAGMIDRLLDKAETQIGFMDYECYQTETNEKLLLYVNYKEKYFTLDRGGKIFFSENHNGEFASNFVTLNSKTKKLNAYNIKLQTYQCKRDIF